jgi:hypothetical protein
VDGEVAAVVKAAEKLGEKTNADPLSALQRVLDRTNDLEKAGDREDPEGIAGTWRGMGERKERGRRKRGGR